MKKILMLLALLIAVGSVYAISFTSKADINLQNRYNVINHNDTGIPVECLLTNSWLSRWSYNESTCWTMNYTAVIGYTYPTLAGTGKALLCVDANGLIYRGNATGCP